MKDVLKLLTMLSTRLVSTLLGHICLYQKQKKYEHNQERERIEEAKKKKKQK